MGSRSAPMSRKTSERDAGATRSTQRHWKPSGSLGRSAAVRGSAAEGAPPAARSCAPRWHAVGAAELVDARAQRVAGAKIRLGGDLADAHARVLREGGESLGRARLGHAEEDAAGRLGEELRGAEGGVE